MVSMTVGTFMFIEQRSTVYVTLAGKAGGLAILCSTQILVVKIVPTTLS